MSVLRRPTSGLNRESLEQHDTFEACCSQQDDTFICNSTASCPAGHLTQIRVDVFPDRDSEMVQKTINETPFSYFRRTGPAKRCASQPCSVQTTRADRPNARLGLNILRRIAGGPKEVHHVRAIHMQQHSCTPPPNTNNYTNRGIEVYTSELLFGQFWGAQGGTHWSHTW